ncbi:MAG: twin transmembrane helix small protein [Nitratireductor sp.]|nr:twin transmembrane helix small protein [Nitratireductor sp.]
MTVLLPYVILVLVLIVAVILVMGLFNMARGGAANRSQMLMRWRVIAQFVAILAIVAALYFLGR